jgi:P pilus assembly chaperone PapD
MITVFKSVFDFSLIRSSLSLRAWVMRIQRIAFFLVPFIFFCARSFAGEALQPQFGVQPSTFMLDITDKPLNESLTVFSMKKRPITMRVEVYAWTLDDQGQLKLVTSSPKTLDQWMVINPLRFTIPPSGSQVIRFSVRPRIKPEPGEYRAIIYLVEEPDAQGDKESPVQFVGKFGVGVYGNVEPVVHAPKLIDLSYKRPESVISLHLRNSGNVHARFRGRYIVWEKESFPGLDTVRKLSDVIEPGKEPKGYLGSGAFPGDPVLAGTDRLYKVKVTIPKVSVPYFVVVLGELDEKPVEKVFE